MPKKKSIKPRKRTRTVEVLPSEHYLLRAYRSLSRETRHLIVAAVDEYGGLPVLRGKR